MYFSEKKSLFLTIGFSITLLIIYYSFVFQNPSKVFFSENGDGIKEYYSSIYHIKFDTSYLHCSSMNYPYGEDLKFFGIQSIPVNCIKFIAAHTAFVHADAAIIYINFSMIISLLFSSIFIHLILEKLKLPWWVVVLFATPISFLSPQIDRFTGHFPLAISCIIPMSVYLLMRFHEKKNLVLSMVIGMVNLYVYEIHAYFFLMTAGMSLVYFFWFFCSEKEQRILFLLHFGMQVVVPFVAVVLLDTFFTTIHDRTGYPWGHMFYLATPESVFLPVSREYFVPIALQIFKKIGYMSYEGRNFTGYMALCTIALMLIRLIFKAETKPFKEPTDNKAFNVLLLSTVLLLLLSFGFPYILELKSLIQYSGPIKQLRALGRFSWPFYYVINIFSVYYIYTYFNARASTITLAVFFLISICDLNYVNGTQENKINNSWEDYNTQGQDNPFVQIASQINPDDFCAILPLPAFSIGSENINVDERNNASAPSYALSLRTGLPIISSMSSRLSFQQAYAMQQIYFEPYRENIFWKHIQSKSPKPVLVMVLDTDKLSAGEKSILKNSSKLFQQNEIGLYSFDPSDAYNITDSLYEKAVIDKPHLSVANSTHADYYYNAFEHSNADKGYLSSGTKKSPLGKKILIDSFSVMPDPGSLYYVSFWYNDIYKDALPRTEFSISAVNDAGDRQDIYEQILTRKVKIIDKHWALFEDTISLSQGTRMVYLYVKNDEITRGHISIDDVLMRKKDQDIYFIHAQGIVKNNRLYIK